MNSVETENIKKGLAAWADEAIAAGAYPIIGLSLNEAHTVTIHRSAKYDNVKLAALLRYVADRLESRNCSL